MIIFFFIDGGLIGFLGFSSILKVFFKVGNSGLVISSELETSYEKDIPFFKVIRILFDELDIVIVIYLFLCIVSKI